MEKERKIEKEIGLWKWREWIDKRGIGRTGKKKKKNKERDRFKKKKKKKGQRAVE